MALALLVQLADQVGLADRLTAMFSGQHINVTEDRAVLHTALRAPAGTQVFADGQDVVPDVHAVLDAMSAFAMKVREGSWLGFTDQPIRNVVNIGIGGCYEHGHQAQMHLLVAVRPEHRFE